MPVVNRQQPKPSLAKASTSVLDRIAPVKPGAIGLKLLIYGRSKTGKTRLACTFPKPLLLIGTEDGTRSVSTVKGVDFVRLIKSTELDDLVDLLRGGKYASACLDTAGGLQDLILKEILNLEDVPVQKTWGMAQQKDWQVCGAQLKERLRNLLDLADKGGLNVVTIAHERNFNEEGNSDIMLPSVGAALTPSAVGWLNGACDYICQTFIREKVDRKSVTIAGKEVPQNIKTGQAEYCLRTGPHPVFMTGFRLPEGITLPDALVNPTYTAIAKMIRGEK